MCIPQTKIFVSFKILHIAFFQVLLKHEQKKLLIWRFSFFNDVGISCMYDNTAGKYLLIVILGINIDQFHTNRKMSILRKLIFCNDNKNVFRKYGT